MDNCPCMDIHKIVHAWISPCTLVVASHARYALVNIVMGDIADIEKKKSKGLSTLLLGAKPGAGIPQVQHWEIF